MKLAIWHKSPLLIRLHKKILAYVLLYINVILIALDLDYIAQHGRMSEAEARKKFWQILSAVEYCHDRHVVHRDLKVSKVLFFTPAVYTEQYNLDLNLDCNLDLDLYCDPEDVTIYMGHSLFNTTKYITLLFIVH